MEYRQALNKDSRPFFPRNPGEMGMYIDFLDVKPVDSHEYGSQQYMNVDFLEKLYESLSKIPLYKIKGALERKGLMDGVIIERWIKGVVLAVSFDSQTALDRAWDEYDKNLIAPVIVKFLNTPDLLKDIRASSIQLRTQMWKDEHEVCKKEMDNIRLKAFTLKDKVYDQQMLREIKHFQKTQLMDLTQELKDSYTAMDKSFSQVTISLKKNIPIKVTKITNFQQFIAYYKTLQSSKKGDIKAFEDYINMRKKIWDTIDTAEDNICHRLAEIHVQCETVNQSDMKQKIKTECIHAKDRLSDNYDWSHLKHPEWQKKILNREHAMFLGMASVIGAGMDTLFEIDIQCDDYLSGVDGVKI